ncbi:ABC transporter substrate-binding protein [Paenibacillus chungangensis]|uniref:ABC transporter substrate-binding protein n=1 Tax=Paenibacillus chungangensis TaxID=696535 RepID=A0ABW3HL83_9BACL
MRKSVPLLVSLALLLNVLAGCGKNEVETSANDNTKKRKGNVTITYALWSPDQEPGIRQVLDQFEADNPGIKVKMENTPWDEYWTKLEAAATGGVAPDVFWMHANQFVKYASNGILLDVGNLMNTDDYPSSLSELYQYDGVQYAVPKDFDTVALFYNTKLFDDKGIPYPDDTWDYDKLLMVAKQMTDQEKGIYGFGAPNTNHQGYYNLIYQNGGYVIADDKTHSGYNQPEAIAAVQFYKDLIDKHQVSPTVEQFSDTDAMALFAADKLAMLFLGSWKMSALIKNEDIKDHFNMTVLPEWQERATIYNGLGHSISSTTEHPEEAKKLIEFLASKEAQDMLSKTGIAISAFHDTQQGWIDYYSDYNTKAIVDMIAYGVPLPSSKTKLKWEQIERDVMRKIYSGEVTVEDGMKLIADQVDNHLATE